MNPDILALQVRLNELAKGLQAPQVEQVQPIEDVTLLLRKMVREEIREVQGSVGKTQAGNGLFGAELAGILCAGLVKFLESEAGLASVSLFLDNLKESYENQTSS